MLKARIARLKSEALLASKSQTSSGEGFNVAKTGDARVGFIGFPSVGKSTLMSNLSGVESKAAAYEFTTLTAIPGIIWHRGARIQVMITFRKIIDHILKIILLDIWMTTT